MLFHSFGGEQMKRADEYEERKGIVAKLQQQHPHHYQYQQHQIQKLECHSEEVEVDSRSSGGGGGASGDPKKQRRRSGGGGDGGDGASIEVVKRPRGRPPGSKNKPKPPVVITREAPDSAAGLRPHVLEIPAGHDVPETLARFSRSRNLGLCVLAGTGFVSNVTLRQPSLAQLPSSSAGASPPHHHGSAVTFHGRFEILSISATFFPPSFAPSPSFATSGGGFSISLAGPQGQIVGGSVAGSLMAAGTVTVVAAAFVNPTYHRLPAEGESTVSALVPVSGGNAGGEVEAGHHQHSHHQHHAATSAAAAATTASDYYHLSSDVIWAPTARPPPPPPY